MDASLLTSLPDILQKKPISLCCINRGVCQSPKNGCLFNSGKIRQSSLLKLRKRASATVVAARKDSNQKKTDSHSFIARPDEATGPFPEAVLLKEKKVEKDGKLVPEFADAEEEALYEALNLQLESDLNLERMRHYEVVYLIHEDHKNEVESVNQKVQEFILENKGRVWRFSDWGMRKLAYKIQKAKNAHYILMNFELEARLINDFKNMLDKDERIIRHLVMKREKAETAECPPPPLFHSLQSDVEDDEDWDEEDEFDDDDEDWVDEEDGDEIDMSAFRDSAEGVIYVDEEDADKSNLQNAVGRRKQKAEKVLH